MCCGIDTFLSSPKGSNMIDRGETPGQCTLHQNLRPLIGPLRVLRVLRGESCPFCPIVVSKNPMFKSIDKWFLGYLRSVIRRPERVDGTRHLIFCIADHFEPFRDLLRREHGLLGTFWPTGKLWQEVPR